jgi:hypothetical protein
MVVEAGKVLNPTLLMGMVVAVAELRLLVLLEEEVVARVAAP